MHEQNFEKQVQQKMEELSLTPSAPVWQKVEGQIRGKKDRRRLLFWLLPLLLVGGGAWWLLSGTGDEHPTAATNSTAKVQPATTTHNPANHTESSTPVDTDDNESITGPAPGQPAAPRPTKASSGTIASTRNPEPRQTAPAIAPEEEPASAPMQVDVMAPDKKQLSGETEITKKEAVTAQKEVVTNEVIVNKEVVVSKDQPVAKDRQAESPAKEDTAMAVLTKDTASAGNIAPPAAPVVAAPSPTLDSAALAAKAPGRKIRKWGWSVHAEGGFNSLRSTLFDQTPVAQEAFLSPLLSGTGNYAAYKPSPAEQGSAFSAGVTASRLLGFRTRLLAGLQYNYYSTQMEVGQAVKSATAVSYSNRTLMVDNYYLPGEHNSYRNEYHFIQAPIGIEYQAFRNLPLQLQAGVSIAHLVSTNALVWDNNARMYYQNSEVYNKTQLHLFTNLTYTLWKGKMGALNLGPYVQYGLTELQKEDADKNRLFSAGLRTHVSF